MRFKNSFKEEEFIWIYFIESPFQALKIWISFDTELLVFSLYLSSVFSSVVCFITLIYFLFFTKKKPSPFELFFFILFQSGINADNVKNTGLERRKKKKMAQKISRRLFKKKVLLRLTWLRICLRTFLFMPPFISFACFFFFLLFYFCPRKSFFVCFFICFHRYSNFVCVLFLLHSCFLSCSDVYFYLFSFFFLSPGFWNAFYFFLLKLRWFFFVILFGCSASDSFYILPNAHLNFIYP